MSEKIIFSFELEKKKERNPFVLQMIQNNRKEKSYKSVKDYKRKPKHFKGWDKNDD